LRSENYRSKFGVSTNEYSGLNVIIQSLVISEGFIFYNKSAAQITSILVPIIDKPTAHKN